jgi:integrase
MLYLHTGQRGSDIVRLGFTDIDEGGFSVRQRKTGRDVWCPIVPELASDIRRRGRSSAAYCAGPADYASLIRLRGPINSPYDPLHPPT